MKCLFCGALIWDKDRHMAWHHRQLEYNEMAVEAMERKPTFRPKVSTRGKPVDEATIRRVAEIVATNSYSPRCDIQAEFGVSPRTASRWLEQARKLPNAGRRSDNRNPHHE